MPLMTNSRTAVTRCSQDPRERWERNHLPRVRLRRHRIPVGRKRRSGSGRERRLSCTHGTLKSNQGFGWAVTAGGKRPTRSSSSVPPRCSRISPAGGPMACTAAPRPLHSARSPGPRRFWAEASRRRDPRSRRRSTRPAFLTSRRVVTVRVPLASYSSLCVVWFIVRHCLLAGT
jgi:hypothetical protein